MSQRQQSSSGSSGGGLTLGGIVGAALAGYCSYLLGNPVGWIAIHAIFNWFYILYLCMGFGGGFPAGVF
jgi:hypothetical protein